MMSMTSKVCLCKETPRHTVIQFIFVSYLISWLLQERETSKNISPQKQCVQCSYIVQFCCSRKYTAAKLFMKTKTRKKIASKKVGFHLIDDLYKQV